MNSNLKSISSGRYCSPKRCASQAFSNASIAFHSVKQCLNEYTLWFIVHYENLNDVGLSNTLETLFYDYIGVFNDIIQKMINDKIEKLVGDGVIEEW